MRPPRRLRRFVWLVLLVGQAHAQPDSLPQSDSLLQSARALFGTVTAPSAAEIADPKVQLGRALFWDVRLSASGEIACASCHTIDAWGADRRRFSIDARGRPTSRHAQTVFNAQQAKAGLRWVGDRASGAEQALGSITGSMGFEAREELLPVLRSNGYERAFVLAFGGNAEASSAENDALSAENYAAALEAYQRTLRTPSAFDRWLGGDPAALGDLEREGLQRFIALGCAGCHDGALLGGNQLRRFGVVEPYAEGNVSADLDEGLFRATGNDDDRFVFRVQPLRNVARTAPYFHDGAVDDLAEAVRIMARTQLGLTLAEDDVDLLVAFLETLTGPVPPHYAPPPPK